MKSYIIIQYSNPKGTFLRDSAFFEPENIKIRPGISPVWWSD